MGRAVWPLAACEVCSVGAELGWCAAGEGAQPPVFATTLPVRVVTASRLSSDQTIIPQSLLAGPGMRLLRKNRVRPAPDMSAGCTALTGVVVPGTVMLMKSIQSLGV